MRHPLLSQVVWVTLRQETGASTGGLGEQHPRVAVVAQHHLNDRDVLGRELVELELLRKEHGADCVLLTARRVPKVEAEVVVPEVLGGGHACHLFVSSLVGAHHKHRRRNTNRSRNECQASHATRHASCHAGHDVGRHTVPNPNPKGEGSNRSLLFPQFLKNRPSGLRTLSRAIRKTTKRDHTRSGRIFK